jgi:transposase-like protein
LLEIINEVVKNPCLLITDEFSGYNALRNTHHLHVRINHQEAFANGIVHTNNIESFWATLKRGVLGIYHHVSVKHLQDYLNEYCFRYNHRGERNHANPAMFDLLLKQSVLTLVY